MSNTPYVVHQDYLDTEPAAEALTVKMRKAVDEALAALAVDPRPAAYGCENVRDEVYRIHVPVGAERVEVMYDIDDAARTIDVVRVRRAGRFGGWADALEDLLDFEPGK